MEELEDEKSSRRVEWTEGAGALLLRLCPARLTCRCGRCPGTLLGTEGPAGTGGRLLQRGTEGVRRWESDNPCSIFARDHQTPPLGASTWAPELS